MLLREDIPGRMTAHQLLASMVTCLGNGGWEIVRSICAAAEEVKKHRQWMSRAWIGMRAAALVPVLRAAVVLCLVMSVMLLWEKLFMVSVSLFFRFVGRRPVYRCDEDEEVGSIVYPTVLVQVPLFNEREVYQVAIRAACNLSWPSDRLVIQVLDDSTDPFVRELVKDECERWLTKGMNINLETRDHRKGYKAGALKEGMKCNYVQQCEYVAIFDADHQPESDFLSQTIPILVHNPELALVQARWKFVNADECLMTRIQEMSMDYHFKIEQKAGASTFGFFGFNGTAGVWRILAINDADGWNERTTVEDMDLAVRASLRGWKFVYAGDIKVKSELPSTFKAYRYQQHRWACGPANLFRHMACEIIRAKKVSIWMKFYLVYSFFFVRKIISHIVSFFFYTVVIPISIFFPQVEIPKWGAVYIPACIAILNSLATPSSLHLIIFWILFEQVMSFHRCKAVYIGLLEAGRANEWVVTHKFGSKQKADAPLKIMQKSKLRERLNVAELFLGVYLLICASYDYVYRTKSYYLYIFPLSIAFLIVGFGYVGIQVPGS